MRTQKTMEKKKDKYDEGIGNDSDGSVVTESA